MLLPSHKPSPLLFLKFVYVTRPLRHSLVVHTLPKNTTWIPLQIT